MGNRANLLNTPVTQLLQILAYERRFPDFPKDFYSIGFTNPDYVPPHKGDGFKAAFIILTVTAILAVALRFWARRKYQHAPLWWDDHTILISIFCLIAWTVVQLLVFTIGGVGWHVYDVPIETLAVTLKLQIADQLIYNITAAFIKTSIFLFIYRITPPKRVLLRTITIISIVTLFVNVLIQTSITLTGCTPHAAVWDLRVRLEHYNCIDFQRALVGFSIAWSITDLLPLLLPMPLIWGLDAPISRRAITSLVTALGLLAFAASVVKIFYLGGVYNTWDPTWNSIPVLFWHHFEICIGVVAACVPTLTVIPVWSWFQKRFGTKSGHSEYAATSILSRFSRRSGRPSGLEKEPYGDDVSPEKGGFNSKPYMAESWAGSEPNLHISPFAAHEKELNLIPSRAQGANIQTTIAGLNPLPQPDTELMLQYPRPAAGPGGQKVTFVPKPAMWRAADPQESDTKIRPGSAMGSSFRDSQDGSRPILNYSRHYNPRRANTAMSNPSTTHGKKEVWRVHSETHLRSESSIIQRPHSAAGTAVSQPVGESLRSASPVFRPFVPHKKSVFHRPDPRTGFAKKINKHAYDSDTDTLESLYQRYHVPQPPMSPTESSVTAGESDIGDGKKRRSSGPVRSRSSRQAEVEGTSNEVEHDSSEADHEPVPAVSSNNRFSHHENGTQQRRDSDTASFDLVIQGSEGQS